MLQVTRRMLSLTTDGRQGAYGRPRQKVMIIAGLGHVMCHPAKSNHPRDGRTPWDGSHPQHHNYLRDGREVRDGRTRSNKDIRIDRFHYYSRCS